MIFRAQVVIQGGGITKMHFFLEGMEKTKKYMSWRCTGRGMGHNLGKRRFQLGTRKIKTLEKL